MSDYVHSLGVKCPLIASADHGHAGSGYALERDAQQLDIMDGHTYWQHPSDSIYHHAPMVNDPFNSTVAELSRTAIADKPYTVSEVNNPFPNQFACEGIPILAAYGGFLDWDGIIWYTFEPKRNPDQGLPATFRPHHAPDFSLSLRMKSLPFRLLAHLLRPRWSVSLLSRCASGPPQMGDRSTPGLSS
jgi:hypothetical protein